MPHRRSGMSVAAALLNRPGFLLSLPVMCILVALAGRVWGDIVLDSARVSRLDSPISTNEPFGDMAVRDFHGPALNMLLPVLDPVSAGTPVLPATNLLFGCTSSVFPSNLVVRFMDTERLPAPEALLDGILDPLWLQPAVENLRRRVEARHRRDTAGGGK
jgi:hypothetical protein